MKLYWSIRIKLLRFGCGSGRISRPRRAPTARTSAPRFDSSNPNTINDFKGYRGRRLSTLTLATIEFGGTVGRWAKYFDPRRPFSSAVTRRKRMERRGLALLLLDPGAACLGGAGSPWVFLSPLLFRFS